MDHLITSLKQIQMDLLAEEIELLSTLLKFNKNQERDGIILKKSNSSKRLYSLNYVQRVKIWLKESLKHLKQ